MNIIIPIFFSLLFLSSCNFNNDNWPITATTELEDSVTQRRFTMVDQKTCKLPETDRKVNDSILFGKWTDTLLWLHEDDCIFAVDQIDHEYQIELRQSKRCIWKEKFTHEKLNDYNDGVFWTESKNDSNFLIVASNKYRDTTFDYGDTMFMNKYFINYFDSNNLFVTSYNFQDKKFDLKTIHLKRE